MTLWFRPLSVLASSAAFGVALGWGTDPAAAPRAPIEASARHVPHPAGTSLPVLRAALGPVAESYVAPERVDPERMLEAALRAVERQVPETLFRRDPGLLHVHVGERRTTLDIPPLTDLVGLERALERVAGVVLTSLPDADIPRDDPTEPARLTLELAMGAGIVDTLDPHSSLLPPDASRQMDVENRGEFGGLGIQIVLKDERVTVDEALPGQPAALAGVRAGDHIRRIDGQSTINLTLDETVDLLRGPVGAPVALELMRAGIDRPVGVEVVRGNIKIHEVEAYAMAGGVGYLRLPAFHASAAPDLRAALLRLAREEGGLRGVILDLRDNPGGYLNQAVGVADLFLPRGEIVSTLGPHDARPRTEIARGPGTFDEVPMAVLVNAYSASASEIVAGALRAHDRAVVVGERTFGKGSVQNLLSLPYDARLKLTIAHYLTPGDRSIQSRGIPADLEVVPLDAGRDDAGAARVSVYGREGILREADLDAHLEGVVLDEDIPAWRVQWVRDPAWQRGRQPGPQPAHDGDLRLALDLIQGAASAGQVRRADILAGAGGVVARWAEVEDGRAIRALSGLGIDWADGPVPARPRVAVEVDVGAAGTLRAGAPASVTVRVTNAGDAPLHRLVAVIDDREAWLSGEEFVFGRVAPGATAEWTVPVTLPDGNPTEVVPLDLSLRVGDGVEIDRARVPVRIEGRPLPRLAWSWALMPDEDGVVDVGDVVRLVFTVDNVGDGPATGAVARIRNRAGRAMDILTGTLRPGTPRLADGTPCDPVTPGWVAGRPVGSDDPTHPRVVARLAPEWPEGCAPVLAPGEAWGGAFEVVVREPLVGGYALDLRLEEDRAFDVGTIARAGLVEHHGHEEVVRFALGSTGDVSTRREPPRLRITRAPPETTASERVTVSGRVEDDRGVAWVLVFAGDDKVGFEDVGPGGSLGMLPFTAEVPLKPGQNTISVVARDAEGWTSTVSRVVWRDGEAWRAQVDPAVLP